MITYGKLELYDDYQLNYFNAHVVRKRALDEFDQFAHEIIDNQYRRHRPDKSPIVIFNGNRRDTHGRQPFNLDLHWFDAKNAHIVVDKFLNLIEKYEIKSTNIIHGKSGDTMFYVVMDCLKQRNHKLYDFDSNKLISERQKYKNDKAGETSVIYLKGNDTLWPFCSIYDYDEKEYARREKFLESMSNRYPQLNKNTDTLTSKNKDCFIATTVYNSNYCRELDVLRNYRDNVLLNKNIGKLFCAGYYRYGKYVANVIGHSEVLKTIIKTILDIIVGKISRRYDK